MTFTKAILVLKVAKEKHGPLPCSFQGRDYVPLDPQADTGKTATYSRVVMYHHARQDITLEWVDSFHLVSGWIVGLGHKP